MPIDDDGLAGKVGRGMVLVVGGPSHRWWRSSQGRAMHPALLSSYRSDKCGHVGCS
jgi:hypothetical protein